MVIHGAEQYNLYEVWQNQQSKIIFTILYNVHLVPMISDPKETMLH